MREQTKFFTQTRKIIKEFERLQKQVETGSRVAHFLHPDLKPAWAGSNEHSPVRDIIPQTKEELQRRLDICLANYDKVSDKGQKGEYLARANVLGDEAKNRGITLDSKSLERLEKADVARIQSNTRVKG